MRRLCKVIAGWTVPGGARVSNLMKNKENSEARIPEISEKAAFYTDPLKGIALKPVQEKIFLANTADCLADE